MSIDIRPQWMEGNQQFDERSELGDTPISSNSSLNSVTRTDYPKLQSMITPQKSKRRVQRSRKIRNLLNALPVGVKYIGDPHDFNEERMILFAKKRQQEPAHFPKEQVKLRVYESSNCDKNCEAFLICQFVIDIELVTIKGLIAMRSVLPSQEYRLLKNRKCARESRKKRKQQSVSILDQL